MPIASTLFGGGQYNKWMQWQVLFSCPPKSLWMVTAAKKLKDALLLGRKAMTDLKKQRHHSANKGPYRQSCDFSSSHVWMWELDHEEGWRQRIDAFKLQCWRRLESPLDCREMKLVNPIESQPWIFIGQTDAEAPILWPLDMKSQLTGKASDAGEDWRQKEKGWQRVRCITDSLDVNLSKLQDSEGQRSLVYYRPWDHRVRHDLVTEQQCGKMREKKFINYKNKLLSKSNLKVKHKNHKIPESNFSNYIETQKRRPTEMGKIRHTPFSCMRRWKYLFPNLSI